MLLILLLSRILEIDTMSDLEQPGDLRSLIRRFWWIAPIIIVLLILICGLTLTQAEQLLKLFNPPATEVATEVVTEPAVTAPPTEAVTPSATLTSTSTATDTSTLTASQTPTETPTLTATLTSTATDSPTPGCKCEGVDLVCPDKRTSYNAVECGGSGQCDCREPNKTWACPDGTYADFNPQCGVGGGGQCTCICTYRDVTGACVQWQDSCTQASCVP